MIKIAHRVNTAAALRRVPTERGVEVDLRDRGDRLILQHDPFSDGEDFEDYLRDYHHRFLILNIKSERIEHRVLELVHRANITEFFLLDCSFPMIRLLAAGGERRIALRFSEYEPVEGVLAMAGKVDWVWVDCFTRLPLTPENYRRLEESGFKLCVVSPELQGRPVEEIGLFMEQLSAYPVHAVCTKRPDLWTLP